MSKIKIITGWSNPGGSTVALINLCNLFNDNGHECVLYGPHDWHLGQCPADLFEKCKVNEPGESIITHFLKFPERPPQAKKVVLACHEKDVYPIHSVTKFWDEVSFVSKSQQQWQRSEAVKAQAPLIQTPLDWCEGVVIPNVICKVNERNNTVKMAGVIGSIDRNKNTHVSVERAIEDGHKKVLLYGKVTDDTYYKQKVEKYVNKGIAVVCGYNHDRGEVYGSVSDVYHSSLSETFNYIKPECEQAGVDYHGLKSAESGADYWEDEEILTAWEELLEVPRLVK